MDYGLQLGLREFWFTSYDRMEFDLIRFHPIQIPRRRIANVKDYLRLFKIQFAKRKFCKSTKTVFNKNFLRKFPSSSRKIMLKDNHLSTIFLDRKTTHLLSLYLLCLQQQTIMVSIAQNRQHDQFVRDIDSSDQLRKKRKKK